MPAPSANTTVVLAVSDGASTVTKNVTVRPSPAISDATVVEMVLGKAVSLNDFAAHLGAGANSAFFKSRLRSLTGVSDAQAQTLLSDSGQYKAHAMSRSQIAPDLVPVSANTAWTTMAQYFAEDCGDFDCGCDPQVGECDVCPPDCGIGSAPPPDPTPGLSVVGVAWAPEIDPQTGTASGVVDAVLQNPYGLDIVSAHVSSTVSLTPGGAATNTVPASYPDHAIAETYTQNEPSQATTYTTSGFYELVDLSLIDINGQHDSGGPETWNVAPASATWSPDATPSISSVIVVPNPISAGAQGSVDVVGLNFGVGATLQFSCADASGCGGGYLSVVSYLEQDSIHVNATVQASPNAAGNYNVQVISDGSTGFGFQAGGSGNSAASNLGGPIPVLISAPVSTIFRCSATASSGGSSDGTDITATTQNTNTQVVVVGQRIVLSATVLLPPSVTVVSQTWGVPGATVGGFNTTTVPAGPTQAFFGGLATAFYWFNIGALSDVTYAVTFSVNLSNGQTVNANAVFKVEGPTNANVAAAIGGPALLSQGNPPKYSMGLGGVGAGYGITFSPSITSPADFTGTFVWGQIIDAIVVVWTPSSGGPVTCSATGALDFEWPYAAKSSIPDQAVDSPRMPLAVSGVQEESYTMTNHMYLMWQPLLDPATQKAIPVPLGSVPWQWYGDATFDPSISPPPTWRLSINSYARPAPTPFQPGAVFPTWNAVFNAATSCPAAPGTY